VISERKVRVCDNQRARRGQEVSQMFKRATGSRGVAAVLARPEPEAIDPSEIVLEVGAELTERFWPANPEVLLPEPLPVIRYPRCDLRRLMEILLGRAISAMPPNESPGAVVASRCEENIVLVSVRSSECGVFRNGAAGNLPLVEAAEIVERNGGHFWVDDRFGSGAVAYFTAHAPRPR
jgi:hypothetical protein